METPEPLEVSDPELHEQLLKWVKPFVAYGAVQFYRPPEVGRNDPCPCNSGRKYKKCCGEKQ